MEDIFLKSTSILILVDISFNAENRKPNPNTQNWNGKTQKLKIRVLEYLLRSDRVNFVQWVRDNMLYNILENILNIGHLKILADSSVPEFRWMK